MRGKQIHLLDVIKNIPRGKRTKPVDGFYSIKNCFLKKIHMHHDQFISRLQIKHEDTTYIYKWKFYILANLYYLSR